MRSSEIEKKVNTASVEVNSLVKIELTFNDGDKEILDLVFTDDTTGKSASSVTLNSPLGKSIFHKKVGDEGSYRAPTGNIAFKILDVK